MYRIDFGTLWEKARVGCSERTALKHVYYQGWNRSPAQVGCMRQVLRAGALGRPRGMGWRGRREGRSGWGIHVNPWLIHVSVWQNPLQYCKVISLQLIKINEKKDTFLYSNSSTQNVFIASHPSLPSHGHWCHKTAGPFCAMLSQEWDHTFVFAGPAEPWWVCHSMGKKESGESQCFLRPGSCSITTCVWRFHCYFHFGCCFIRLLWKLTDQLFPAQLSS